MQFALFLGCNIPARLEAYEVSSRAVLERLGVTLMDIPEFNCCGYPMRNSNFMAFLLSAARNLALAVSKGLNIITLCQCCYGSLKNASRFIKNDESLKDEINRSLAKEGLRYTGKNHVRHLLDVLYHDIRTSDISKMVKRRFSRLKIATHYGCHALRPGDAVGSSDPDEPGLFDGLFDELVEVTGAVSVDWQMKKECCGAPLLGVNDVLSLGLTAKKLANARQADADFLCTACPYCQMQFDACCPAGAAASPDDSKPPAILYSQLLGLSIGLDEENLGLSTNHMLADAVIRFQRFRRM